ncbi:expressed unknown protein [Seminavis robusta]|uniref:Uncharacterized protein n=1 Tax=Seminavis robusta TaxID=568900 RepID=A0A9N8DBH8_9STRA|nr:expressed unknown protein [Seminavis robusta]|eukprot:Sro45_g027220.1 n/a (110) ;mRNA; f:148980-149309
MRAEIADGSVAKKSTMTDVEEMRRRLQDYYRIPIALRKQGTTKAPCPFCGKLVEYPLGDGHQDAQCDKDELDELEIEIGERVFIPGYGVTVIEYPEDKRVVVPDNLIFH